MADLVQYDPAPAPTKAEFDALNSKIENVFAQSVSLATFDNSSQQTLTLSEPASNFLFLSIRLHGSDGSMVGSCTLPTILLRNLTAKIYGESSEQWGTALLSSDYTQITFNRTSANTSRITVYGNIRVR